MKSFCALPSTRNFAVCLLSLFLVACTKSGPTAVIADYGIYDATISTDGDWKLGKPVEITSLSNVRLTNTTTDIPSKDGIYWGMRLHVNNPSDQSAHLKVTFVHPPITKPDNTTSTEDLTADTEIPPHRTGDCPCMWFFLDSCPFEFVPGNWTIRVEVDGKTVTSKTFTVYKP